MTMVGLENTAQTFISPATQALARTGENACRLEPMDTSVTVLWVRNYFPSSKTPVKYIGCKCFVWMCIYPPQSLAESHLCVCRCQLSHSQHSLLPDFGPCLLRTALLKLASLALNIGDFPSILFSQGAQGSFVRF